MLRIATWNVERPKGRSDAPAVAFFKAVQAVQADIWILTETHDSLSPGAGFTAVTNSAQTDRAHEDPANAGWPSVSAFPWSCGLNLRSLPGDLCADNPTDRANRSSSTARCSLGSAATWQGVPAAGGAAFAAALNAQCTDWLALQAAES